MRIPRVALWIVLTCGVSGLVSAQAPSDPKAADFGPANLTHVRVGPFEWVPFYPQDRHNGPGVTFYGDAASNWNAPVHLPGGALLKRVELDYCDSSDIHDVIMWVSECDNQWQNCAEILGTQLTSNGGNCSNVSTSSVSHRIDNYHKSYFVSAIISAGDGSNSLGGAILSYQLDVSPAPATATFADVPVSSPQFQFVEALVAAGITAGCGPPNYCPNQPVTRGQMAVFIAKALGLSWAGY